MSFSFCDTAWLSWPLVSSSRSSSVRTRFGRVLEPPPQREDLLLEGAGVLLQLGQLVLLADGDHLLDRCLLRGPYTATFPRWLPGLFAAGVG